MFNYKTYRLTLESGDVVRVQGTNAQEAQNTYAMNMLVCGGQPERVRIVELEVEENA